ncbi:MAG: hypothetical protein HZA79_08605 [Sphingobacteriales bacterium]|nr:hypothetical protein [Sphingobacteriales bacterium]
MNAISPPEFALNPGTAAWMGGIALFGMLLLLVKKKAAGALLMKLYRFFIQEGSLFS